uniref:Uncharacterized protein n=1 Tax=Physcomitrium patens TaxID=3218 RepID=A0A2K1L8X7_PHYPA|nr:hypothetical protein PHYPA_000912 [Physcomitrium patens]
MLANCSTSWPCSVHRLHYKVHQWTIVPKTNKLERNKVYFLIVWKKPHFPLR